MLVILADDMGFSDIGCFGAEIRTPNLDRMAGNGMRFTQMYNCARCCPTRASLLTGLYPHQAGVGFMIADCDVGPAYQGFLRPDCLTIGEVLQQHQYRTCYAGKWHASPGLPILGKPQFAVGSERNPYPLSRGFDRFYGTLAGCGNYFNPHGLMDQDRRVSVNSDSYYYTDAISERACHMISEAVGQEAPFFLHVCYTAPHWPLHARPEDVEPYRELYRKGWDYFRGARQEALQQSGLIDRAWDLSPRDSASRDFFGDPVRRQEWEALRMAVYAAQVESMDRGIGKILQKLDACGMADNTLVMFLSDNGGCAEFLNEDGDDQSWPGQYRHSARPGETCVVGNIEGLTPGPATTFMSYDLPWANLSNTPFRLYKHWVHEGGIATPCIVQWPNGATKGGISRRPCHVMDIMATCLDAAGIPFPDSNDSRSVMPPEGESMLPAIGGNDQPRAHPLFWEHEGNAAVREGDWKLVRRYGGNWELYNMAEDRTELRDLAPSEGWRVQRMAALYREWAERCDVRGWPLNRMNASRSNQ